MIKFMRMRRREAIATGLLLFPVLVTALSMFGFVLGNTIGRWQAALALALTLVAVDRLSPVKSRQNMLWFLCVLIGSVVLSGVFVMYTNADAEYYHRPGAVFLANGWNPLQQTEVVDVQNMMGGWVKAWCVAFIPRMSWILGAALSKWIGFAESSDALNIMIFFASLVFVYDWLVGFVRNRYQAVALTFVLCLSPVVVSMMWGGSMDAAWYSAFLIAVVSAGRKQYLPMMLGMITMSGVKFTGVVMSVLIFAAYGLAQFLWDRRALWGFVKVGILTGVLILLVNASPYITSFINHGGPFYPSHSFVESERFADDKNPITNDLTFMNDDAREVGWAGRIAWAYVSQDLVKWYYGKKLMKANFNPDFQVSGGVGGFGRFFRVMFVLSLLIWPFVRQKEINILAGLILFSVLIQPTVYSGYARYVPQFYLFPILIGLGLMIRCSWTWYRWCFISVLLVFMSVIDGKSFCMLPLQWLTGVQNLQVINAAREAKDAVLIARTPYSRSVLQRACGAKLQVSQSEKVLQAQGKYAIGSYFRFYKVYVPERPADWYELAHVVSQNDPTVKANRNANNIKFFFREFLPREICQTPRRLCQLLVLRYRQIICEWKGAM